jgi:hypothetical protein
MFAILDRRRLNSFSAIVMCCLAYCSLQTAPVEAVQSDVGRVANADTFLVLQANANSVQLISIASKSGSRWLNSFAEALPASVLYRSKRISLRWQYNSVLSSKSSQNEKRCFVFECQSPPMVARSEWCARDAHGPIEHRIVIENHSSKEYYLPFFDSLRCQWQFPAGEPMVQTFIDKGAGRPTEIGTHIVSIPATYSWNGFYSSYGEDPHAGRPVEIIPWTLLQQARQPGFGVYLGIESSARCRLRVNRKNDSIETTAGLDFDSATAPTRLPPGSGFETPTIFIGATEGDLDTCANTMRRWVKNVLCNKQVWQKDNFPPLVNNTWGAGMKINDLRVEKMMQDAARLSFEMFHIDAGWFKGVGDWRANPTKFPHGLAPLADKAHQLGMKFGLWVNWSQAGLDTARGALNVRDPAIRDWLVADLAPKWKTEDFRGQIMDIGYPPVKNWVLAETERLVRDNHLDMLEHDGYLLAQNCSRSNHAHARLRDADMVARRDEKPSLIGPLKSNSTDVSYHAARAYYEIQSHLRRLHPDLILEVCNDGGRMVDFGSAAHGDYFSITDAYDPVSNRRAFYDASYLLPSAMLETYVQEWPTPNDETFRYMLRSGMMGWLTVMLDTNSWSEQQHKIALEEFSLYKSKLRPLIRSAELYHISPRPDANHWDGIEYFDASRGTGAVFAFRGDLKDEAEKTHCFKLKGLALDKIYTLHFQDGNAAEQQVQGSVLMNSGLTLHLEKEQSSQIVLVSESK